VCVCLSAHKLKNYQTEIDVQGESETKQSLQLFIFQQRLQIFEWNFTHLLNNKMYTLTPTFVEIYLKMTNLYRFNHENPIFAVLCIMFIQIRYCIRYSFKFKLTSTILSTE